MFAQHAIACVLCELLLELFLVFFQTHKGSLQVFRYCSIFKVLCASALRLKTCLLYHRSGFLSSLIFLEAFELSELGHSRSFSEQTGTFSASIGSFQGLPAEASEVILLPQRLALKYNTTPPPPCQHFLTDFFIFFLALLKNVHFLVFNVLFLRKKPPAHSCTDGLILFL